MNAQQFRLADGITPVERFWYCGKCGLVHHNQEYAEECCTLRKCKYCDGWMENSDKPERRGWNYHSGCQYLETLDKAVEIQEGESECDVLYVESDNFHFDGMEEILDYYFEPDKPQWCHPCIEMPFHRLDVEDILQELCERAEVGDASDYESSLNGVEDFAKAVDAFNEANADIKTYTPDCSKKIRIPWERIEASQ